MEKDAQATEMKLEEWSRYEKIYPRLAGIQKTLKTHLGRRNSKNPIPKTTQSRDDESKISQKSTKDTQD